MSHFKKNTDYSSIICFNKISIKLFVYLFRDCRSSFGITCTDFCKK